MSATPEIAFPTALEPQLLALCQELEQPAVFASPDPYWPKWDLAWWKLAFLLETDQLFRLSDSVFERFAQQLETHYLHSFPLHESELPPGLAPQRQILCHCALGTALQILQSRSLDPWQRWPWLETWFAQYQLPDGGYNCDEQVYTHSQRSSPVSTLPMLEALLAKPQRSEAETQILRQGVGSLLRRKLYQSSQGAPLDPLWLLPLFPRFYHYDLLRALKLVLGWAEQSTQPLASLAPELIPALAPALNQLHSAAATGSLQAQPWYPAQERTLVYQAQSGQWEFGATVTLFSLLAAFTAGDFAQAWVTRDWEQVLASWQRLQGSGNSSGS